ncbi:MAG: TPM domain-containing protein [Candidatus Riflebacteria bacterium]|nr:TPM domain-containing protein [Candidatus Riflebacteria bacterium]
MMRNVTLWIVALLLAASALPAEWQPPAIRGYTTDVAGALRPDTVRWLDGNLQMLDRQAGVQLAVLLVPELQGTTPFDYAQRTFDAWKIGNRSTRKGLLFLVATGDRKVRLHVGYGLEGELPDGKVGALLDSAVTPRFKAGDLDGGVMAGVGAVMETLGARPTALGSEPGPQRGRGRRQPSTTSSILTLLMVLGVGVLCTVSPFWRSLVFQMLIMSATSGRSSGGSFSGGSGFGGFGGGSSGGGGADRGW